MKGISGNTIPLISLAALPVTVTAADINTDSLRLAYPSAFQAVSRHQSLDSLQAEVKRQLESRYGQH